MAVKLRVDSEYSDRGLKKARSDVSSFNKYAGGMFRRLGATIAGVFAFNQIKRFVTSSISAFMDEERATKSLAQALEISGQSADEFMPKLTKVAAALQMVAKVEDDAVINAMSLGTTLGIAAGNLDDAAAAAVALNKKFGVDMEKGMRLVGNALAGNTAGLARFFKGLTGVKNETDAYNVIAATTSNILREQAALASTNAEKAMGIKIAFGELQEQFGAFLMNSGGVSSVLDEVLFAMEQIQLVGFGAWFEEQFPAMDGFIDRLSQIFGGISKIEKEGGLKQALANENMRAIEESLGPLLQNQGISEESIARRIGAQSRPSAALELMGPPEPTREQAKAAFIATNRRERDLRLQDALKQIQSVFSGREAMTIAQAKGQAGGQALSAGDLFERAFGMGLKKAELGTSANPMVVVVENSDEMGGLGD